MSGIINVLKPPGMTSNDVVSFVKRVSGIKKVGHTGTLDPGAAGVLPVCIGKATKVVDFIMNDKKTYICELTLGNSTDTYDRYGTFKHQEDLSIDHISESNVLGVLNCFKGEMEQVPPTYSAIRLNGRRAYDMARSGETFEMPKRKVFVYHTRLLSFDRKKMMLEIKCSKGTYIRSICHDIGQMLGCEAYMSFLIRTETGVFNLSNSYMLEEINKENFFDLLVGPDFCLDFDKVFVSSANKHKLFNGNATACKNNRNNNTGNWVKIYLDSKEFIGIGKVENDVLLVDKLMIEN